MTEPIDPPWVQAIFAPRAIAVVGASDNPEKIGGRPIKYLLRHGFTGAVYPVNAARPTVQGLQAYPDVASLPEAPDLAVVCVPGEAAVTAVEACGRRGVKVAVVVSSGFAETGEAGRAAQARMLAAARAHGMRLVGPNTQGTVHFGTGVIASFSTLIGEVAPADGPVAIVSQSGAMSVVPYVFLREAGIGVRHAHATGNECDLTVADLAWAAAGDPVVRLILLYLESLPDPAALGRAAARAASRGVPMLALKAGRSERGQAAASSHTGAVATEDRVLDAFFRQHGILRVGDMRALVSAAALHLRGLAVDGPRLAAVSNSGAFCVMAADAAQRHGLKMHEFGAGTRAALDRVLPAFASSANPVDLTAALLGNGALFSEVLPLIASADEADATFISLPMTGTGYDVAQFARDAAAFQQTTGKATVLASPLAPTRRAFEAAGVVAFEHDDDAIAAIGQAAAIGALRQEARRLGAIVVSPARAALPPGRGLLSEFDSLALVAGLGIDVVPHALCRDAVELRRALERLPAPWVVKACSAAIPHKTEHGLVRIGLTRVDDGLAAMSELETIAAKLGQRLDGVIVAPMLRASRELVLGARWDARFGAVLMAGDGGKYVEAMPDVATALYPFDVEHFLGLLERLRMAPLWQGVRGEGPLPARRLAEAGVRLAAWVHAHAGGVASVDVNPLMAGPGDRLVAVDALVEFAGDAAAS